MYKNQLQELAQRSCFNLPSYSCIREGPDHAPRFKSTVNFNGETFESPSFCSTLRQAEHTAAEVALNTLANRGPSRALAARVLDETGVYKNLLQETAHRAGLNLPVYTTVRSGPGHVPVFSCTVELAGMSFSGEPAKTKKQAQKNVAMAAWSALKQLAQCGSSSSTSSASPSESEVGEEQEQVVIARVLSNLRPPESNKPTQNDSQDGHMRSIPIYREPHLVAPSLYPMQYERWAYPNFPTELALYQMWQQAQLSQLQSHLPAPPYGPQVIPHVRSVFHPDHRLCFAEIEKEPIPVGPGSPIVALGPSLYTSSHSIPDPISRRPMVTIQEIQEERKEKLPNLPPAEVLNLQGEHKTQPIIKEPVKEEDKAKKSGLETRIGGAGYGFRPIGFDSSRSNVRPNHPPRASSHGIRKPPFAAAPVMTRTVGPRPPLLANQVPAPSRMRTGVPSISTVSRMEFGSVPRFVAPAVQIRSVIPVCSAPPLKNMPSSSEAGESSKQETKNKNTGNEDVTEASSELSKLRV